MLDCNGEIGRHRQLPHEENCCITELEQAIECGPDLKTHRRLNAIHLLLIGVSFGHVLRNSRVSERTLQLWINRYNQMGIDGLVYRRRPGRPRKCSKEQVSQIILPLIDDPGLAQQHHWTAKKLCGWLKQERDLDLSYSTLVRYLHEQDYKRLVPRPMPLPSQPEQWEEQREAFGVELLELLEDPKTVVFFGDEAGFEGDPRPRQKWVKRGSQPTQGYYGGHIRQNVVGAVNPADGQLISLIVAHNNTEVFQAFLDTMAKEVPAQNKEVYLILDNASWHKSKSLNWHHIKAKFLPPYSPDFNPIERLWQHLKSHYLAGYITNKGEELSDKLFMSIRDLLQSPDTIKSVCNTHHS